MHTSSASTLSYPAIAPINKPVTGFVYLISIVAAIGGLLFGYDTGVIAGAIVYMEPKFHLGPATLGWVVSCALLGSIFGASIAGAISDRYGRKKTLLISAFLFSISAVATAIPNTIDLFVIARIFAGMAIGIASMLSPLYIAEVSPPNVRGRLVSLNQLAIVTGFFVVYFSNMAISGLGDHAWNIEYGWRWMFASAAVPSLIFFGLLFLVPESPRWLAKQNRDEEALALLAKVSGGDAADAQGELDRIRESIQMETKSLSEDRNVLTQLMQPGLRLALFVAMILAILQQVTGINAIMYYAPIIFKNTGASTNAALFSTVLVGTVNLLFTFVALWLIDHAGRKALLLGGAIGMSIALGAVGTLFYLNMTSGPWVLLFILMFVASFAASMGPVVWVVISEIFPTRIRGRAMSIATMTLWVATFGVSQTFPMMLASWGPAFTFWFYMVMAVVTLFFVQAMVPETKGKSLEEIEHLWLPE